ncbi:hypothetical protein EA658_04150 [Pseudoxanthomonas winnipegensis]|uniref:RiboL-PSP-HEPN domain-containing protein n=1 Tax=Pseudoxanthomonas winnipegensis TaxID=2480810 RepID=A0ABY1WJ43_9GAMM|nr:hypothetical protein [Pseudoxanthomonas winnipegensis]TAA09845.1 hypothetical protein EA659_09765 [Pseudoxanthomonas winnipegensis]TAA22775.1 hypothetical protein EA658_04150 [Pseudoxanthomonas winnipegensis]TAH73187.1 hypothetical protein EA657_05690 [Pseudoxanthomonas winnipegensis]
MIVPTSEEVEAFHDLIKRLDDDLASLGSGEVRTAVLQAELATAARNWVRLSTALKNGGDGFLPSLDSYDSAMSDVLASSKQRSRASAFRKKLKPFREGFLEKVVVPLMRFEGSPSQVAARQLESLFEGSVTTEEQAYISEAARCSSLHCHRAAIILLWAAGVARMHAEVQVIGFAGFNAAAAKASAIKGSPYSRITKGLTVGSLAELQRGRDFDVIAVGIEIWGYDLQAFEELDRLLGLRNSAAHPGMFTPTSLDVRVFAEKLKRYVFDRIGK